MLEPATSQQLDHAMRSLATASRSLRLYPPASPLPLQTVSLAVSALDDFFAAGHPLMSVSLARDGFACSGEPIATSVQGAVELACELRSHGVAEIDFEPGVTADELLAFLTISARSPDEVLEAGGLGVLAASAGVDHVRVIDIQLTSVDSVAMGDGGPGYGDFLRDLVADPSRLSTWFSAASKGDPATFEDGLTELLRAAGSGGLDQLVTSMRTAFLEQSSDGKDALMGLSMDDGPVRDLAAGMFGLLSAPDIAGSVLEGRYGKNMLSLSSALTNLPLENAIAEVRAEVQAKLPASGHTAKESAFLAHMLEVRVQTAAERPLVDADRTYRAVLQASHLDEQDLARARTALSASAGALGNASVRTMLALLDQQQDFELYCAGADNLASMVPTLIAQGDLELASRVLTELANREVRDSGPWPELSGRLRAALRMAAGADSMAALIDAVVADPGLESVARQIIRHAGDTGATALTAAAIAHKAVGLDLAERLMGRRLIDLLHVAASSAQWFQLQPIVTRLADAGDPRSVATLETLLARPDAQSRREVATGLASLGTPSATRLLGVALRDANAEVAIVAARAIARSGVSGSAALLAARLHELDLDAADFLLAREIITGLAHTREPAATDALAKIASRRAFIKRGHFVEIQQLVAKAQAMHAKEGVLR